MPLQLSKTSYNQLNDKQKEAHNFQKVSAVLADYGYSTIRLQDDWQGADFIAQHCSGTSFLKVQLKGRAELHQKYIGKDICVAFPHAKAWYIYEHDLLLKHVGSLGIVIGSASWTRDKCYSWPSAPGWMFTSGSPISPL